MDVIRSQDSSQSELILLISTDSSEVPPPPKQITEETKNMKAPSSDSGGSNEKEQDSAETLYQAENHPYEVRKKSRQILVQKPISSFLRHEKTEQSKDQVQNGCIHKSNVPGDVSSSLSGLGQKSTFDTLRTEKTGKSLIRSWIKKKVFRFKNSGKDTVSSDKSKETLEGPNKSESKKILTGRIVVVNGKESIDYGEREDLSIMLSSISIEDIHKVFGSEDNSIEVIEGASETIIANSFSLTQSEHFTPQIDFRNRLEIYKARPSAYSTREQFTKTERMNDETNFTLLSFSLASSDSDSGEYTDEESTDDNLAEAIAKEMNLRRLIMGESETPRHGIREVTIPATEKRRHDILSPRLVNESHQRQKPLSTRLTKPKTPLDKLAGYFFGDNENNESPHPGCGASQDLQIVPTFSP